MAARAMTSRTYLSIGDVLSLLREEFPDVTISKIRFLESQGLVDPERSPSGYRKFYDEDVARLRWVLRKQRDQFLPLKVIRDRLAAAGDGVPPDDEPLDDEGWQAESVVAALAPAAALREGSRAVVGTGSQVRNGAEAQAWSAAPDLDDAEAAASPYAAVGRAGTPPATEVHEESRPAARAAAATATATAPATGSPVTEPAASPVVAEPPPSDAETKAPAPGHLSGAAAHARGARGRATATTSPAAADVLSPSVSGVSLTLAELCAATGLTPEIVASLEGLGLLAPMSMAGATYYDEEALTVGKLVVEFARYGVEPRHLRMYRNAVDREVGLVEQVTMPLLRQRNPEARQRAVDAAADLARLGQSMRASLVRTELRRQLGS
jgi:DNA-binding transcriptional MerR regulator